MATPGGLEPPTCRLEGGCSIQLSYGAAASLPRVIPGLVPGIHGMFGDSVYAVDGRDKPGHDA